MRNPANWLQVNGGYHEAASRDLAWLQFVLIAIRSGGLLGPPIAEAGLAA